MTTTTGTTITVSELADIAARESIELIDVRTPREFREVHAVHARNVPLDGMNPHFVMEQRGEAMHRPLYVICRSGGRSIQACRQFWDAGYSHVVNVEGGTSHWDKSGLPVVRGQRALPIDRQVRIIAGALTVAGAALSLVHPGWIALSAACGLGLVHAGVTDSCLMGNMLCKAPWNQ